jgi:hypothetical protein
LRPKIAIFFPENNTGCFALLLRIMLISRNICNKRSKEYCEERFCLFVLNCWANVNLGILQNAYISQTVGTNTAKW